MASLQTLLARYVGVRLKGLLKGERTGRVLAELNRNQWLPREELQKLRTDRLRNLLGEVGRNVPFYRDAIRAIGADPLVDDPWRILQTLPTLDKAGCRAAGGALRSERPTRKVDVRHTSGTTGERLEIRLDRPAAAYLYLAGFRGRAWWGIHPGDAEFKIWGGGLRTARTRKERTLAAVRMAKDWVVGVTVVSPFFHTDDELHHIAKILCRTKPKLVFGYANGLYLLADYLLRKGIRVGPGWPLATAYTSEMLHDWQEQMIRDAFGAPIVSEYGSCEAGVMAYMCPQNTLHVSDDIMHIEILEGDQACAPGETDEVVVTNLMSWDYPLIRYRQGDLASLSEQPCACGRSLGVMKSLVGRMNDILHSPSGKLINFIVFDKAMKDQPAIRRFKVVERDTGNLVVLCEPYDGQSWPDGDRNQFVSTCRDLLPSDVAMEVRLVSRLAVEPSGKFRIIIPKEDAERYLQETS